MNLEEYIEKNKKIILNDIDTAIDKIKKDKAYNFKYKEYSLLLGKFKKLHGNEIEELIKKQDELKDIEMSYIYLQGISDALSLFESNNK